MLGSGSGAEGGSTAPSPPRSASPARGTSLGRTTDTRDIDKEEKGGRKEISEFTSRALWPLHLKSFIATGWCFGNSTWLMIVFRKATFPAGYRHHVHSKPSTPGNPVNFPCYTPVKEAAPGHSSARPLPCASLPEKGGPKPSPSPGTVGFMLQDSMPRLCPSPAKEAGQFCYKQKIETT